MYSHAALWDEGSQGKGAAWALGLRGDLSLEVAGLTRALPARMCMGRAKITSDRQGSAIAPIGHGRDGFPNSNFTFPSHGLLGKRHHLHGGMRGGTQQWPLLKMVSPRISVPESHT